MASNHASSSALRLAAGSARQCGSAALAASIARRVPSAPTSGMLPTTSPFAGLRTASADPSVTHAPPIYAASLKSAASFSSSRRSVFVRSASAIPSSYRRAAAFCAQDIGGPLRRVPDEKTHLWMTRLDVDGDPLLAQFLGRRRTNRRDRHRRQALPHSWLDVHLARDVEKMDDL